jgi:4-hydroxy 2-oxovalerate aldolase
MTLPRLTDITLRDGSHAMRHQFTCEQVHAVVHALDDAGVPVIEVTHGDGLAGSSIQSGFSLTNEMDLIEEACSTVTHAKIAALLIPGIGTRKELKDAIAHGIQVVRIATQCTEADVSL